MTSFGNSNNLLLIINPVSGKGAAKSKLFEMVDIFSKHGYRVTVMPTESEGKTEKRLIEEAKYYDLAVAVGGDGTLNTAINGLLKSQADTKMGYIPLGSTNDFANSFGLTKDIETACIRIATNEPKRIDVGKFGERYFAYIACAGLFASTSYSTSQRLKNVFGHSAYLAKGASELANMKKIKYTVELENETISDEFLLAAVTNAIKVAGVFTLPKDNISFDDGLFELTMARPPKNMKDGAGMIKNIIDANYETERFVTRTVSKAHIIAETPLGWSLDGENGGEHNDVWIEIKQQALNFIY